MNTRIKKIAMTPDLFNEVIESPIGLGMGRIEYEHLACHILNKHIEKDQPFDQPMQCEFDHFEMVRDGYLEDHGNKQYTLTKKSLSLLWAKYSK